MVARSAKRFKAVAVFYSVRMGAAELGLENVEGAFVQGFGLDQVAQCMTRIAQKAENAGHIQVLGPKDVFLNGQGSFKDGLRTMMVILVEVQRTQIAQARGHVGVMRTMHAF